MELDEATKKKLGEEIVKIASEEWERYGIELMAEVAKESKSNAKLLSMAGFTRNETIKLVFTTAFVTGATRGLQMAKDIRNGRSLV